MPKPTFFKSAEEFAGWLERNHHKADELWVGYHRKATGKPSVTYPESVDVALCYGWIDGVRKSVDETRYMNRFSPRRPGSNWSAVNIRRAKALIQAGRVRPAGLEAFEAREAGRSGVYSYENRPADLPPKYRELLKQNKKAWSYFNARPPWYRRTAVWWVVSAKREETRLKRLSTLIEKSARGKTIPPLTPPTKSK
jgi:uncharacterized protein YdeI (YjbR/CyaY-like superfamily)